jgi:O-antigen/teichoic acid export membrane protein
MAHVSKNIFWLSLSRVTGLVLLFFAYTQLFRYLGPYGTGQYQFVLSLVTIFGVIIDLGISQYVTKKVAEDHTQAAKYFYNFFVAEVVLAAFVYAAMVFFVFLRGYEPVVREAVMVAGAGLFLYGLTVPFLAVLSGFQELRKVAINNFVASLVNVGIIFSAVYFKHFIVFLALNQAIASACSLVLYYRHVKKYIPGLHILEAFSHFDYSLLKTILRAAAPFALLVSFSTIYNRVDVVLVAKFLGYEQTGLYTTAYKMVDLTNFFPAVVSHSLYPALAALMARKALGEVRTTLEKYLRFMIAVALPIGVGGTLLSRQLILVLTSGDVRFLPSAPVLAILVWAIVILFIYVTANSLVVSQLTKWAVIITGLNVIVNIAGNVLLVPHFGIRAAAVMTVVSEGLQGVFYFYFISKNITQFNFAGQFVKPVCAGAVMAVVLWLVRDWTPFLVPLSASTRHLLPLIANLVLVGGVGVVSYVAALGLLRFFSAEDVVFIKRFLRRS